MSAEKLRLLAVAEMKVPWEVIYARTEYIDSCSVASYINLVPPVEITHPQLNATVKLQTYEKNIDVNIDEYKCSQPTRIEYTVTKCMKDSTIPVAPEVKTRDGGIGSTRLLSLYGLRSFTLLLKIFAIDYSLPPALSVLLRGLNEARLRGDSECDLVLCVEGAELRAHKLVLAKYSEVLAMKIEIDGGRLHLKNITKAAAELFLEYVYTGYIVDFKDHELDLLDLAERYGVDDLSHQCKLRLWTVEAPRALRLLQSCKVKDMRDRLARIVLDSSWNQEDVQFTQDQSKALAAPLLLAAGTPPATLSFPCL